MCFEVHLRLKNVRLIRLAFGIQADKMSIGKVLLEFLVIEVVLRIAAAVPSITDMTSLMPLPTMSIEFVVPIKSLFAESTVWMALEARLVDCTWVIITKSLMLAEFCISKQFVFMGEDLLVSGTEITHHFLVRLDVAVEIGPSQASYIAVFIRTVVSQEKDRIFEDDILFVFDTQVVVNLDKVGVGEILEPLLGIVGKYHKWRLCLDLYVNSILVELGKGRSAYSTMCTSSSFVQRPQS